ncbi:hypothetical protein PVK06_023376 [Gossypium arboreum]|uniref:Uncharacterized protein n=1 Tax=Gossypium arboreum TaxID=29729 RepID=A0ABR0PAZ5_GOSAR|nr:hypothetical protein PVK06_023376 [Gossypium arboreum]
MQGVKTKPKEWWADAESLLALHVRSVGLWKVIANSQNPNYGRCFYNVPIPSHRLEIHLEVLAIIKDGDKGSGNKSSDNEGFDSEDLSDSDLDDISKDIDDEGFIEGENVYPHSTENTRFGVVIRNNPVAFITDVDLDAEFSKYLDIVPAHLLDEESKVEELFVGQQFDNK